MRLACLFVPLFPLAARLRSEPALNGEAVAVFEGNGNIARVIAATRKARQAGIEVGMTLAQTRAILPKLVARARDREGEHAAQEALLEVADSFSPRVEDGGEGVAYFDLDGIPALHGPASGQRHPEALHSRVIPSPATTNVIPSPSLLCHPEPLTPLCHPELSEGSTPVSLTSADAMFRGRLRGGSTLAAPNPSGQILRRFAPQDDKTFAPRDDKTFAPDDKTAAERRLGCDLIAAAEKAGLPARAGIASSKLAARVAAGLPESPTVVPAEQEASFLAPLPLSRLAPALEIAQTLDRWGLRSIGDLARLPEGEVASRLGELGRALHATARGIDPRPLEPRLAAPCFSEGMDLEWPLVSLEPFLFVGAAALERLMQRLESQALACTRLEIALKLDPDGCDARAIQLPAPTRDVKTLLTLVRLELDARPPGAAIVGFTFSAHPDRPRRAQLALFGPQALSPDRLAATIARLAAMLGADRVGSPRTVDGHRPERFALANYDPPAAPPFLSPARTGRGLLAVRVLRPPVELEVITSPCHPEPLHAPVIPSAAPVIPSPSPLSVIPSAARDLPPRFESSVLFGAGSARDLPSSFQSAADAALSRPISLKSVSSDAVPQIAGAVRVAAGPWSMEEGWWLEPPVDRVYWDIELSDGTLYRLYRDCKSSQWFADGIYD